MNEMRPVKVGDVLSVRIEAVGEKGDGIAKKDGFVLFVPNTVEGDEVKVRVTKVLRRVGFAEVVGSGESAPKEAKAPVKEEPAGQEDSENFGEEPEEEYADTNEDFKESESLDEGDSEASDSSDEDLEDEPRKKNKK
jgi:predicted RNA-binding protein with TRAM domain